MSLETLLKELSKYLPVSHKSPVNEPLPLHVPQQSHLWRDTPISRALFYISLYPETERERKKNLMSGLQIPFSPGVVCKPDKLLDVPRTVGPRIQSFLDRKVFVYNGCK